MPSFEWISTLLPADCTVLQSACLHVVCPVTYRKRHIRTAAKHTLSVAIAWSSDEMKYFILWITSRLVWSCHPLNWQMNLSLAGTMDTICTVSFKDHSRQVHLPPQGATAQPAFGITLLGNTSYIMIGRVKVWCMSTTAVLDRCLIKVGKHCIELMLNDNNWTCRQ